MFTDCPYCGFLVALDAAGQPLARCPNCAQRLRSDGDDDAAHQDAMAATTEGEDRVHGPGDASAQETSTDVAGAAATIAPQADRTGAHDALQAPTARTEPQDPAALASGGAPADARPQVEQTAGPAAEGHAAATTHATTPAATDTAAPQPRPVEAAADAAAPSASDAPAIAVAASSPATAATVAEPTDDAGPQASSATAAGDGPGATPAPAGDDATRADAAQDAAVEARADASRDGAHAAPAAGSTPAARSGRARPGGAAPSFVRSARTAPVASRRRRTLEAGALLALSALLAVQLLVADRARLAGDARWRPLVSALCGALRCALPAWREPAAFRVIERDVRTRSAGVLRVSARIRNEARWAQPWPALQLTLSDAHGREVATRIFQPREYLGGTPTQSGLASGQDAALSMDIVEPGPHAVAFTFDFL